MTIGIYYDKTVAWIGITDQGKSCNYNLTKAQLIKLAVESTRILDEMIAEESRQ